ncbi:hypothetical protein Mgra_00006817 [Meloidogyne graminicola]|uniref:Uncharacterized protein n=1 Tax=Meloidogyne graminicola TaxID=189291 RepID=A0A8S9ZKC0_9BILA|nr:hypothetical protein Mgra_00006817 [Meloidogyne graminicola]
MNLNFFKEIIEKGLKALPRELLNELLKSLDRISFRQAKNILSSSCLVYLYAKEKYFVYKYVENKWKYIDRECCNNKCVNTNNPNGLCSKGNGFARIKSNTEIVYINCKGKGYNKFIRIESENYFNKPIAEFNQTFTLYYYEVKLIYEKNGWIFIGLRNGNDYIYLLPKNKLILTNTILLHTSKGMPPYLFVALPFCCPTLLLPYQFVALTFCCFYFFEEI